MNTNVLLIVLCVCVLWPEAVGDAVILFAQTLVAHVGAVLYMLFG